MNKQIAENVAQETSNIANTLLDKVDSATGAGRTLADQGARRTQQLIESGIDGVNRFQNLTTKQISQCTSSLSKCMKDKPVQSALVIAGVGALLALLLTSSKTKQVE